MPRTPSHQQNTQAVTQDKWEPALKLLSEIADPGQAMGAFSYESLSMLDRVAMSDLLQNQYVPLYNLAKLIKVFPSNVDLADSKDLGHYLCQMGWIVWAETCALKAALDEISYKISHPNVCAILESTVVNACGDEAFPKGLLYQLAQFYHANKHNLSLALSLPVMEPAMEIDQPEHVMYPRELHPDTTIPEFKAMRSELSRLPLLTDCTPSESNKLPGVDKIHNWIDATNHLANQYKFPFASSRNLSQAPAEIEQAELAQEAARPRRYNK